MITISEVRFDDMKSLRDLGRFYRMIFCPCFTDENERETLPKLKSFLKKSMNTHQWRYHILLAKDAQNQIVGGIVFDYFREPNAGVLEFLAVLPNHQRMGIGSGLYREAQRVLNADARLFGKSRMGHLFIETDKPRGAPKSGHKNLFFFSAKGFKYCDFDYIQPALSGRQKPVHKLWFCVWAGSRRKITSDIVRAVLFDYLRFCMPVRDPLQNPQFQTMNRFFQQHAMIMLKPLVEKNF